MPSPQEGILAPAPEHGRFMEFTARPGRDAGPVLRALAGREMGDDLVVGLGPGLLLGLAQERAELRPFPSLDAPGCNIPSSQADLWCWLRGRDRGSIALAGQSLAALLAPAFECVRLVDGFTHDGGRDLTGYVDGTENPTGDDAVEAAIAQDGSSFVAVQQWRHDLRHFAGLQQGEQDDIIGRRLSDNVEFEGSPPSAHVKRTAQESFEPEAFILRRSMPWADEHGEGLMFVAFGKTLDAFEVQLRRMCGLDDGIADGLFEFTRPITGGYYWCPAIADGRLDLGTLGA